MATGQGQRAGPHKIVVIGGGTGNSTVLSGLKPWVGDGLTAIANTFDDGGGTGRLREEYAGLPAVGDLRQCLRALSNLQSAELELLAHRFHVGIKGDNEGLHGQTLGNLIITAAAQMRGGNFAEALTLVSRLYNITGQVVAASHDNRRLKFTLPDGRVIEGQHEAEVTDVPSFKGALVGFDTSPTRISPEADAAIRQADIVVLAPGDLYTSLAPNLAVEGMQEALQAAPSIVLISNLMNRSRHTAGYTVLDYAQEYDRIIGAPVIERILYNTGALDAESLAAQARLGSHPVVAEVPALESAGYQCVGKDLISRRKVAIDPNDALADIRSVIRHDSDQVAYTLMTMYFSNTLNR